MSKLKTLMEGVDPHIGGIFVSHKRWLATNKLVDDAGIHIDAAGLFDDVSMVGKDVTRFWVMSPLIKVVPLTNQSDEHRSEITVTSFFTRLEDDTQEVALQKAMIEIIGKISEKVSELTTLNTGTQYMGYLTERPEMTLPVQAAVLDEGGVHGHTSQFRVTFFEEVPRA